MNITYEDINRRICKLNSNRNNLVHMEGARIYTEAGRFCKNNAFDSIKNWETLDENVDMAFSKALNIFTEMCYNCNSSEIRTYGQILAQEASKVRDQSQLMRSLKYRMALFKKKPVARLNKSINDLYNSLNINFASPVTDAINNIKNGTAATAKTSSVSDNNPNEPSEEQKAVEESFNNILNIATINEQCDRILKNYNMVSKRFNLDRIINEIQSESDSYDACIEIARCIDSYSTSFKTRYFMSLEMAAYVFDKHYMNYPKENIVEAVTDYFIFSGVLKEEQIDDAHNVMNLSVLYENSDFHPVAWLWDPFYYDSESIDESCNDIDLKVSSIIEDYYLETEKRDIKKDIVNASKGLVKSAKQGNPEERKNENINKMLNDFRKDCVKNKINGVNIESLRSIIKKVFTKTPREICESLPNIFAIFRVLIFVCAFTTNAFVGIVYLIGDFIIKLTLTRQETDKIIKKYENEIKLVERKIDKTHDESTRKELIKYRDAIQSDLYKIEQYADSLYTDEENNKRYDEKYGLDFDEACLNDVACAIIISDYMTNITENLIDTNIDGIIFNNIFKLSNDNIDALTDFSITVPDILSKNSLKEALEIYRDQLRNVDRTVKDYTRIDCVNENLYRLEHAPKTYNTSSSIRDCMLSLACVNEICKMNSDEPILEMEFSNTIKLAINNLKKAVVSLGDKEKDAAKSIDVAANNVIKGIKNSLMITDKKAVLNGTIMPSLSKCIKLALTFAGVSALTTPTVAVIGAIAAFICSSKLKDEERQLALDDIEIELRMCERYMRKAEEKDDMDAIRQIEMIQRELKRTESRIKHKMNAINAKRLITYSNKD